MRGEGLRENVGIVRSNQVSQAGRDYEQENLFLETHITTKTAKKAFDSGF